MRTSRLLTGIEVHAEGEQGTVYIGGVFDLPGRTMAERLAYLNSGTDDSLRRLLCHEPRGRPQASAVLVFPPAEAGSDAGLVILQSDRAHAMSGSNTICTVTALLETGVVAMREPTTEVVIETAAGIVRAVADCRDGRCASVALDGIPSYVEQLDVPLAVPGLGEIVVDVAYGGCFYVLVDVAQTDLHIVPGDARALAELGGAIYAAAAAAIPVQHPVVPDIDFISYVMFTGDDDPAAGSLRNATILRSRLDRSPCGTGSSARLACMAARGQAAVGDQFTARSVIDSEFAVGITAATTVGPHAAVQPRIAGRGFVHGTRQVALDPDDPYPVGFTLSDLWS